MKKILLLVITFLIFVSSGILYSSKKSSYQVVDLYICDESVGLAEMLAKASVSRKELYTVSYCNCLGVHPSMKSEVTKVDCKAPKNLVYSCICVGRSHY